MFVFVIKTYRDHMFGGNQRSGITCSVRLTELPNQFCVLTVLPINVFVGLFVQVLIRLLWSFIYFQLCPWNSAKIHFKIHFRFLNPTRARWLKRLWKSGEDPFVPDLKRNWNSVHKICPKTSWFWIKIQSRIAFRLPGSDWLSSLSFFLSLVILVIGILQAGLAEVPLDKAPNHKHLTACIVCCPFLLHLVLVLY